MGADEARQEFEYACIPVPGTIAPAQGRWEPARRAGREYGNQADLANAAVALRTTGSSNNSMGKATSHEMPHAASHLEPSNGDMPMLFKVLISETTQVIRIDSSKGMTKAP